MPNAYPPGMFAFFAPLAVVGQVVPMSRHAFGVVGILYMLAVAHVAMLALEALAPGARVVVGLVGWMLLVRLGLEGFFDSAWIGCGAMMVRATARGKPEVALRWLAAAELLHFRAVALAPLGIAALADCVRDRHPSEWPWPTFGGVAAAAVAVAGTFALMYPATSGFRAHAHNLLEAADGRLVFILAASAVTAALAVRWSDMAVGGLVAIAALLAVVDFEPWWWHGTLLRFAAHGRGWQRAPRPWQTRGLLVAWLLCIQPLAFNGSPGDLFFELARHFRLRTGPPLSATALPLDMLERLQENGRAAARHRPVPRGAAPREGSAIGR